MGGMPSAILVDAAGRMIREVRSAHLPLGIDEFDWRQAVPEALEVPAGGAQLVMFSDGLIEAQNGAGEPFGTERLCAALAAAPPTQRLDAVKDAVALHLGEQLPHDDVTLMLVDLPGRAG